MGGPRISNPCGGQLAGLLVSLAARCRVYFSVFLRFMVYFVYCTVSDKLTNKCDDDDDDDDDELKQLRGTGA